MRRLCNKIFQQLCVRVIPSRDDTMNSNMFSGPEVLLKLDAFPQL